MRPWRLLAGRSKWSTVAGPSFAQRSSITADCGRAIYSRASAVPDLGGRAVSNWTHRPPCRVAAPSGCTGDMPVDPMLPTPKPATRSSSPAISPTRRSSHAWSNPRRPEPFRTARVGRTIGAYSLPKRMPDSMRPSCTVGAPRSTESMIDVVGQRLSIAFSALHSGRHCGGRDGPRSARPRRCRRLYQGNRAPAATSSTTRAPISRSPVWPPPWIRRARPMREAEDMQIFEGTNQIQRLVIARQFAGQ